MTPLNGHALVTTTTATREEAQAVANAALEARQAACVQIVGPIESRYWWQGAIEVAEEWLCLMKKSGERVKALRATIRRVHSYDTPEITVTHVVDGDPSYLAWIDAEATGGSS